MIWHITTQAHDTFTSGAPPQAIANVILPKQLPPSQLHPPALLTTDNVRYGGPTSTMSVIEYGDYQCDACKTMAPILNRVIATYHGDVRFVWHDFPITTNHPQALNAAIFAYCAGKQGKYWEAHDELLAAPKLNKLTYTSIAENLQLNIGQLSGCRADPSISAGITHEINQARGDGFSRAPTIFVGTEAFIGAITEKKLRSAINAFLES